MQVEKIVVGELQANCYIITYKNESVIIDPGAEPEKIIASAQGKNIVGILITHNHFDHVGALEEIKEYFHVPVINHFADLQIISTPGHTSDSKTFYFPGNNLMFTGDFIFKNTIGRMDLPTGSIIDMQKSLAMIKNYPPKTIIYPGHGAKTVLGDEIPNFYYYLK